MIIVLYPRAAPSTSIRLWIGLLDATQLYPLSWTVDGDPREPIPVLPLKSIRPDWMLSSGNPVINQRAFSGIYEFSNLSPDTAYNITVTIDGQQKAVIVKTIPNNIVANFNVLLVSCFHQTEDKGLAGLIVAGLPIRPQLTFLMGDQVYLDLPTLMNFPDDIPWLAEKFERDYLINWGGHPGYGQILASSPTISIPDDHEYWNNYPHPSPFIENSLTQQGRDHWKQAARTLYEGFQQPFPVSYGEVLTQDIPPISFFIADCRSLRDPNLQFTMNPSSHQRLNEWVDHVINQRLFGVFVSGQSLCTNAEDAFKGKIGDYNLPNYKDYPDIVNSLYRLIDSGLPVLCITGDVHWGRVISIHDSVRGQNVMHEIISSPSSLVSTIGKDEVKEAWASITGFFGKNKKNNWPRHSNPEKPPSIFAKGILGSRYSCHVKHEQIGNHITMLEFKPNSGGVDVHIIYYPIHSDLSVRLPISLVLPLRNLV